MGYVFRRTTFDAVRAYQASFRLDDFYDPTANWRRYPLGVNRHSSVSEANSIYASSFAIMFPVGKSTTLGLVRPNSSLAPYYSQVDMK